MRYVAQYTLFIAMIAMLASGAQSTDAAPYRKGRSNTQRASKPSYKPAKRTSNSRSSGPSPVQRKTYSSGKKYKYNTGSSRTTPRSYVTKPRSNGNDRKYHHNLKWSGKKTVTPIWPGKGGKKTVTPSWPGKGGKKTITPSWPGKGGKKTVTPIWPGKGIEDRIYPGPKQPGPIVTTPGRRDHPVIRTDIGRLNPKDIRTLPGIGNLNKGLNDFWKKGNKTKNPAELKAVRQFANKCIRAPAACGWWFDFCCHHWWDWCCYPNYWHCWNHCYWDTVYCPSRVVVVNGTQQVLQEVSYYLGMSGSQIPQFGFGIQQVKPGSPAERAGLKQGDVIVSVNGQQMTGEEVLSRSMQQAGGVLDLEVVAQGSETPRMVRVVAEQIQTSSF